MEKILRFSAFSTLILLGIFYTITAEILPLSSNTGNERPIIDHGGLDPNLKIKDPDLSSKELEVIKNFTNSLLPGPAIFTETKDALDKPSLINDGTVLQPTDQDKAVDENDEIRSPTQEKDEDTVRPISGLTDEVQPLDGAVEQSKTIDPSKIASELTDVEEKTETMKPLADNVERKPDILNTDSSIETVDGGAKVEETDDNVADTDTDYGHAPLKDEGSRIMTGNEDWSKYEPKENVDDEVIDAPEDTDAGNERTTGTTDKAYTVTTTAATTDWSVSNKVEDNNENNDLTDDDGDDDKDNDVWATGTPAWTANTDNDWDDGDDDDKNNNEDIWATTTPYTSTTNDYWDDDDDDSKEYDDNTDVWTGDDKDNSEDDDDNMWDDDDDSDGTWNDDNGDDDIWANDWDDDEDYDNDSSEENDEDDGKWRDEWWKADEGKGWKTDSWSTTTEWTTTYDYDDETATDKTKDIEAGKKLLESPHHFDNNAGVFAGAKLPDEKYSMNNEDRHFYTWTLVLGLCLVIGLFVVFYNRHKVERYIVSLRRPVSNGYSRVKHGDEERNLLHHEYA